MKKLETKLVEQNKSPFHIIMELLDSKKPNEKEIEDLLLCQKDLPAFVKKLDYDVLVELLNHKMYRSTRLLLMNDISFEVIMRAMSTLVTEGDVNELIFLIENAVCINPNGINTYGMTPLKTVLEHGTDHELRKLVQLGADPRINKWLYTKKERERFQSIFKKEFSYKADGYKAIELRRTPNIRVAQQLLDLYRTKITGVHAEWYECPDMRSYENGAQANIPLVEFNKELVSKIIKKILSGDIQDLSMVDDREIIAGFYSTTFGGGVDFTLRDLFSASSCGDCAADYDYLGGPFWLISNEGVYSGKSRIRFYN